MNISAIHCLHIFCISLVLIAMTLDAPVQAKEKLYQESNYAPYTWGHGPEAPLSAAELPQSKHPLKEAGELFKLMRDYGKRADEARKFADGMIAKYSLLAPAPTLSYPDAHKIMPENWYSGMGNLFLPFMLLDLGDRTGDAKYTEAAVNLFESSIREVREGGVVIRDDEGCHLVEYAHPAVPYDKTFFVLNGHLLALQSLLILQTHDETREKAKALYDCARQKTQAVAAAFRGDGYPYYQLNPKEVNQISYLIFEMLQFRSLFEMTKDSFYKDEAAFRENILRKAYPIVYRKKGDAFEYLVSLVSFPHPYALETFNTSLRCAGTATDKRYESDNFDRGSVMTKGFIRILSSEKLRNCTLRSDYGNNSVALYFDAHGGRLVEEHGINYYGFTTAALYDAKVENRTVVVDPAARRDGSNSETALVKLQLDRDVTLKDTDLILLKVCTDKAVFHPTLRIGNAEGKVVTRSWPPVRGEGCKLMFISVFGFHGYEGIDFTSLKSLGFYVGTSDSEKHTIDDIQVGILTNGFQVEELVATDGNVFGMTP